MLSLAFKTLSVLSLTVVCLNANAGVGRLVSVKKCTQSNSFTQNCSNLKMSKNRSCSVTTTSLSNGNIGDSDFRGVYSIPAAGKSDKSFKSSIVEYSGNNYGAGIVRPGFSSQQIGEWNGTRVESVRGKYKINIKNFYLYVNSSDGTYTEYHCKL